MRPTWDSTWAEIALVIAKRTTCVRRSVGAVVVRDNKLISCGFNGAPTKQPHCLDIGCIRNELKIPSGERHEICRAVHAEENALLQAGLNKTYGATMYVTLFPCNICAKKIVNAGIVRVVYLEEYTNKDALDLLLSSNIIVERGAV